MIARKVKDSRVIMAHQMLPIDANAMGNVHGGVIMKLIDEAAGVVAIRHSGNLAVTASIDALSFHHPVFVGDLLIIKASLNMTGTTSMEVGVRVEAENLLTGKIMHTASAYLTFVAVKQDSKPAKIPDLELVTDKERNRNKEAIERRKIRLAKLRDRP